MLNEYIVVKQDDDVEKGEIELKVLWLCIHYLVNYVLLILVNFVCKVNPCLQPLLVINITYAFYGNDNLFHVC